MKMKDLLELARFDKPIGSFLLLWPGLVGLIYAQQSLPSYKILTIFVVGTLAMRAAGCIINDIADKDIDVHVRRTKNRPITSGKINVTAALSWLGFWLTLALCMALMLPKTIWFWVLAGILLTVIYPLMKRYTNWPQLILSLAFSIPIPMAYSAQNQPLDFTCLILFVMNMLWVFIFDTQYALVDKEDDILIGVKSTAIALGDYSVSILAGLKLLLLLSHVVLAIYIDVNLYYYVAVALIGMVLYFQHTLVKTQERKACFQAFLINNYIGLVWFIATLYQFHLTKYL